MKDHPITQRIRPRTYQIALYALILAVSLQLIIFLIAPWLKNRLITLSPSPSTEPATTQEQTIKKNFSSPQPQAIDNEGGTRSEANTISQHTDTIISIDPITTESISGSTRWLIPIRIHIPWNQFKPGQLRIQFFLYEKTSSGKIQPAQGRTQVTFVQPSPSWSSGVETLEARYIPLNTPNTTSLYGYQLRIFYQEKPQIHTCNPTDLCNR
jgi:hypothetical protein